MLPIRKLKSFRTQRFFNTFFKPKYQELFERYQEKQYVPEVLETKDFPKIYRNTDEEILQNDWSTTAFDKSSNIVIPCFNLFTGEFLAKSVKLDHEFFNVPLRRDIVHRTYIYYLKYDMKVLKGSINQSQKSGSNKKFQPQKGLGKARVGHKRAPGRYGGVKVHGRKRKMFRIALPARVRFQGLKATLSAILAEGRLRVTSNAELEEMKTKLVKPVVDCLGDNSNILLVTEDALDDNFKVASRRLNRLTLVAANDLNVFDLLTHDRILITLKGLAELNKKMFEKEIVYTAPKVFDRNNLDYFKDGQKEPLYKKPVYDPSRPLDLRFPLLQDYLKEYEKERTAQKNKCSGDQ